MHYYSFQTTFVHCQQLSVHIGPMKSGLGGQLMYHLMLHTWNGTLSHCLGRDLTQTKLNYMSTPGRNHLKASWGHQWELYVATCQLNAISLRNYYPKPSSADFFLLDILYIFYFISNFRRGKRICHFLTQHLKTWAFHATQFMYQSSSFQGLH